VSLESRIAKLEASAAPASEEGWGWVIVAQDETQEAATARTYPEGAPERLVVWNIVGGPSRAAEGLI